MSNIEKEIIELVERQTCYAQQLEIQGEALKNIHERLDTIEQAFEALARVFTDPKQPADLVPPLVYEPVVPPPPPGAGPRLVPADKP